MIWTDTAWWQLLGRTPQELADLEKGVLQYLEQRMLFLRIAVLFGWKSEVERIVVLKVMII